jgi:hypothetical protein
MTFAFFVQVSVLVHYLFLDFYCVVICRNKMIQNNIAGGHTIRMRKYFTVVAISVTVIFMSFSITPPSGEQLAKTYCGSCHLFPEPGLLDKTTWKDRVLPNMGWRLGIRKAGDNPYADMEKDEAQLIKKVNVFPDKPLLSPDDWEKIVSYYSKEAPETPLPQTAPLAFDSVLKDFHAQAISFTKRQLPQTSLLKYDNSTGLLFIGDVQHDLYAMRNNLKLVASWKTESSPVDIDFATPGTPRILCIGSMKPSQKLTGSFYAVDSASAAAKSVKRFNKLARPVACETDDLNGDGVNDIIICQFGNHTGKLSWFDGGDPEKEHILQLQPGARRVVVQDFNGDGKPDILALMAQAREELMLFTNEGKNRFSEKIIYQFPPVYGVSYFELADFNKDGHPDILLTNGDNWDLSPIKKYYHGIRILMNDGKNNFRITHFFPFYGASKAVARDFDMDGDPDIAAIAFYDDPDEQAQTFLYLENKGGEKFSPATTAAAENGKWITMEACDFDRDGDQDIILGSFVYSVNELAKLVTKGLETFPQVVVLWNDKVKR